MERPNLVGSGSSFISGISFHQKCVQHFPHAFIGLELCYELHSQSLWVVTPEGMGTPGPLGVALETHRCSVFHGSRATQEPGNLRTELGRGQQAGTWTAQALLAAAEAWWTTFSPRGPSCWAAQPGSCSRLATPTALAPPGTRWGRDVSGSFQLPPCK